MRYKIFISTSDDPQCLEYLGVVKSALWDIDEMTISSVSAADVVQMSGDRMVIAKQIMETTQLFLGVYGANYGTVEDGGTLSYAEKEYRLAYQRGILCVILVDESAKTTQDERMKAFLQLLSQNHVVIFFKDSQDLMARVVMSVETFRKGNNDIRLLPPLQGFMDNLEEVTRSSSTPDKNMSKLSESELNAWAESFFRVAGDDIDQIIRRALIVHDAQRQVAKDSDNDGWLRVSPIFGEPQRQTQFKSDVFMVMPFREQFDGVYNNIVRPLMTSLNLTIKRGDDFSSVKGSIMQEVWSALNACRLVIAETTEVNANVYYELGIAHTLGKPAILLTQNKDVQDIPFDIRHLRFIVYENTIEGGEKLAKDLKQNIIWLMNDLKETENNANGQ